MPEGEPAAAAAAAAPAEPAAEVERLLKDFTLDEPAGLVTPDAMSQLAAEHPEFGRLLETDTALRDRLHATAREAAELQPYRAIFPDVQAAQSAAAAHSTWSSMVNTFMGSATPQGTMATLSKMAELSYERGDDGQVVMRNGKPVIGEDFFGFVENVVSLDLDHRLQQVQKRIDRNNYASEDERAADETMRAALEVLRAADQQPEGEPLTERQKQLQRELDERERSMSERERGRKVGSRKEFDSAIVKASQDLVNGEIRGLLRDAAKQGAGISDYLLDHLHGAIGAKLLAAIKSSSYQATMEDLQRLPATAAAREQRIDVVKRAIKHYLPKIAREELRKAGVVVSAKSDQAAGATQSAGPRAKAGEPMTSAAAYDQAEAEWVRANPGRPFDRIAREKILPRVLQLMTGAA